MLKGCRNQRKEFKWRQKNQKDQKKNSDFDVWIEDVIQKFMNEQEMGVADTSKGEMIANPQDDSGEELLFLKTTDLRAEDENNQPKNISIKVTTLVEKD